MASGGGAAPKSSLEAMLETIKKRGDGEQDQGDPSLVSPLPARPGSRGRPPTPRRWSLPPGNRLGKGEGLVALPIDEKQDAGTGGATTSTAGADVVHSDVKTLVGDDARPQSSESPSTTRAEGSAQVPTDTPLEPRGKWWRCF